MQEGFRPGRGTSRQISNVFSTLEEAHITDKDLYMLYIDFSSAFNTIGHAQLFEILNYMKYPAQIIKAIMAIYEKPTTVVATPYGNTDTIELKRGTIQGDTLSPLIFTIFIDPMLQWIYQESEGVTSELGQHEANHNGYADDLLIFARTMKDIQKALGIITRYAKYGDLEINVSKCALTATI